jgi:hypothetical protein
MLFSIPSHCLKVTFFHDTNSVEQSPFWEANIRSASQEISRLSWNPKFHYRIHKSPPSLPILVHMNAVQALTSYFFEIHFNIVPIST